MGNNPKSQQALFTVCYPASIIIKKPGDTFINVSREISITNCRYKRFLTLQVFKSYRTMLKEISEIGNY